MCGSCREFRPTFEKFVSRNHNHVKFGAAIVDSKPGLDCTFRFAAPSGRRTAFLRPPLTRASPFHPQWR